MSMHDVVVVGGGISGTMAAVAAARYGARVLIIEQYGFLGGMLTAAGVGPMMTFHAGKEQVIKGVVDELVQRLVQKGLSVGHIQDSTRCTGSVTPFDVEGMKYELERMVLESGGEILYHTMLADVKANESRIEEIVVCNKAGLTNVKGSFFIDATGDADLSAWAGVDFHKGRETDGACQPMTMNLRMSNVDIRTLKRFIKENPNEFACLKGDMNILEETPRLSIGGFNSLFEAAKARGEITFPRKDVLLFETNTPGEVIINTTRILGCDGTEPLSLTSAEIEGRRQVQELIEFLKKYAVGFKNAIVVSSGPAIGVRSSRQIKGLYTLTEQDIVTRKTFEDVVAHSGYPIDIHSPDGKDTYMGKLEKGAMYSIPYRCLVNEKVSNMVTVGRCISATFEAQSAIRTTPTVGAIGQAGGLAAAIAVQEDISACQVDVQELQRQLKVQGGYLKI